MVSYFYEAYWKFHQKCSVRKFDLNIINMIRDIPNGFYILLAGLRKDKVSVLVNMIIYLIQKVFQTRYMDRGGSEIININNICLYVVSLKHSCRYLRSVTSCSLRGVLITISEQG